MFLIVGLLSLSVWLMFLASSLPLNYFSYNFILLFFQIHTALFFSGGGCNYVYTSLFSSFFFCFNPYQFLLVLLIPM